MKTARTLRWIVGLTTLVTLLLVSCSPAPAAPTPTPAPVAEPVLTPPAAPPPPKPARFTVSDLSVTPSEVTAGSSVTVKVTVNNTGELIGTYEVILKIDGAREAAQTVTVVGGNSTRVEFKFVKYSSGTFAVTVDELKSTLTVKAAPAPVTSPPPTPPTPAAPAWTKELIANATATDVTWNELLLFLAKDTSNLMEYSTASIMVSASSTLKQATKQQNNAENAGIRSGVVEIRFVQSALVLYANVFTTSDYGQVYVFSFVDDNLARIEKGEPFMTVFLNAIKPGSLGDKSAWDFAFRSQGRTIMGGSLIDSTKIYTAR